MLGFNCVTAVESQGPDGLLESTVKPPFWVSLGPQHYSTNPYQTLHRFPNLACFSQHLSPTQLRHFQLSGLGLSSAVKLIALDKLLGFSFLLYKMMLDLSTGC